MADGTVVIKIDGEDKEFLAKIKGLDDAAQKALGGTQSALSRVGDGALRVGAALSAGVTAPVTAACAAATTLAMGYEDAFAGVRKTVDMTEEGYDALYRSTVSLSEVQPVSATTLFRIEELGGQLGIADENLLSFAQVVSGMDIATDLGAEDAATEMAQFANITGMAQTSMGNLGSTVVALGNISATTESAIMGMAMRIAGAGSNVGMTQAEILGLSAALSSVGIEAEAGGSAISTVMSNIDKAVATGSESLGVWASAAGMSAAEFAAAWKSDPVAALQAVVAGMAGTVEEGGNLSLLLEDLGVTELRQTDMLKRLSGASDLMAGSVRTANEAWSENTALQREVDARNDTTSAKLETLRNRVSNAAAELGGPMADAMVGAFDAAEPLIQAIADGARAFADMDESEQRAVLQAVAVAAAVGPVTTGVGAAAKAINSAKAAMSAAGGAANVLTGGLVAVAGALAVDLILGHVEAVRQAQAEEERLAELSGGLAAALEGVAEVDMSGLAGGMGEVSEAAGDVVELSRANTEAVLGIYRSAAQGQRELAGSYAKGRAALDVIDELTRKQQLNEVEQERLRQAVETYNATTGDSVEVIDAASGSISSNTDAMLANMDAWKRNAEMQAMVANYGELTAALIEAQGQTKALEEEQRGLQDYIDGVNSSWSLAWQETFNGNFNEASKRLKQVNAELEENRAKVDGLESSIAQTDAALGEMAASCDEAADASVGVAEGARDAAEAADEVGKAASEASGGVSELAEAASSAEHPLAGLRGTVDELPGALHEFGSTAEEAGYLAEEAMAKVNRGSADLAQATGEVNAALAAMGLESVQLTEQQMQLAYMTGMTGDEIVAMAQDMQAGADEAEAMAQAQHEAAEAAEAERERLQGVVDSMAEFADAHRGMREAVEAGGTSLADFALGLDAAGIGVDGFKGSFESLSSMANPMERFATETGLYTTTMRDNLIANAEAVRSYSSNVAELYTRATTEQELAFADYVASLGPAQAQFLEYLLYDADVSFQELAVLYAEGEEAAAQGAVEIAEAKGQSAGAAFGDGLEAGALGIEETAAEAVSGVPGAMADGADMGEAAAQMTGEAAEGIAAGTGTVADAVRDMGSRAADALIEMNGEMRSRGEAAGGFAARGFSDSSPLMAEAAGDLCSALQSGVSGMAAAMGAAGGAAAGALSEGVSSRAAATGDAAASHQARAAQALSRFEPSMRAAGDAAGSALAAGALGRAPDTASAARAHMASAASALSGFAPSMGAAGSSGGQSFAAELQRQMGASYSAASSVAATALSGLSSFNASAYWSGREMGQNFAGGVSSAVGSIAAAASQAAGAAAAYLHFSEPERGPLVGINASGGEMVRNFAASMLRAVPEIERSSERAAAAARFGDEVSAYLEAWAPPRGLSPSWEAASASLSARGAAASGSVTYSCGDVTVSAADSMEAASFAEWMQDVLREAGMY